MPSTSAFARLFQFGMRLGMRSWTIGSAWWQADCGPYWGHNAVIRVAPFKRHCAIPPLPGRGILSGQVLSHDQIEAALMRRAGYDVRVLPEEDLGWEENPPTLIEFLRRDQRWLQGTLQYVFFIGRPGLQAGQPLPARLRHADVHRLAGLDRPAGCSAPSSWRPRPRPAPSSIRATALRCSRPSSSMWFCGQGRRR